MIKVASGVSKVTWGHVSIAHVIAGVVAGGTVFADANLTSFNLTDPQTYVLGAIAVASFLTALGGRYAEFARELRSAAAEIGKDVDAA